MLAVLVEGLTIGTEPSDHRHVGAVYKPVGANVLDALLQGRLRLNPGVLEQIAQLYGKEQLQVALRGLEHLPEVLRQHDAVVLDVASPRKTE